jgi:hypothetical protein
VKYNNKNNIKMNINYRTSKVLIDDIPSKSVNFSRKLENNLPCIPYIKGGLRYPNSHDGQRKLLFSEIEFLTEVGKKYKLDECFCVYVGAADGSHLPLIFDLFPELDFFLCDPSRFNIKHRSINMLKPSYFNKNKKPVFIGKRIFVVNDYFTDEMIQVVKSFNIYRKNIIFISDIREDPDEVSVWRNMISQQSWTISLNSVAYLLKFRLPYITPDFSTANYINPLKTDIENHNEFSVNYLKGDIMLQIYAPMTSTETRLLYVKDKNEDFSFSSYDVKYYEESLAYFNVITRHQEFSEVPSLLYYNLLGYDNGYESYSEFIIIREYLTFKKQNFSNENIIKLLYDINYKLNELIKKNLILCPLINSIKKVNNKKKNIDEQYINQYKNLLIDKYELIKKSLNNQLELFKIDINRILPAEYYNKQIKIINYTLKDLEDIYSSIKKSTN